MIERHEIKRRVRRILNGCKGFDAAITMEELTRRAKDEYTIPGKRYDQSRIIRSVVRELRREGMPICNRYGAGGGYYLAASEDDIDDTCRVMHSRALASLEIERDLRRINVGALLQQLEIELTPKE